MKKIDLMHREFGVIEDKKCGDCPYFLAKEKGNDHSYSKCFIYGQTNSEATDWSRRYTACGGMNLPEGDAIRYDGGGMVRMVHKQREEALINGQLTIDYSLDKG